MFTEFRSIVYTSRVSLSELST